MQEKTLFLGPDDSSLLSWLKANNENVVATTNKISLDYIKKEKFTFLVSYGYRFKISKEILDNFPDKAINLHISLLPWNKGSDPNFWSFINNTPKGVSIHFLDEGLDTGDILIQKEIFFTSESETLASTYEQLQQAIQALFKKHWHGFKKGTLVRKKQMGIGSIHRSRDLQEFSYLLEKGWDTPVSRLAKDMVIKKGSK